MGDEFLTVRGYEQRLYGDKLLTGTMEDYVEMIYRYTVEGEEYIRLNKLADLLNVRDSSASKMMQKLGSIGFIDYEKYGIIKLTQLGKEVGQYLLSRHNTIEVFLKFICDSDDVLIETELIEHILGNETVENIKIFNEFIEKNRNFKVDYKKFREKK
ncbi:MAG: metal-dependent transcriptional regulator [Clostridium sp.]|nr:metal-dependent transcriptional regulator [Clostridium sp.]